MSLKLGSFNHSCVSTPVNPNSGRPMPTYERKPVCITDQDEESSDLESSEKDMEEEDHFEVQRLVVPDFPLQLVGVGPECRSPVCNFYDQLQELKRVNLERLQEFSEQFSQEPSNLVSIQVNSAMENREFEPVFEGEPYQPRISNWPDKLSDFEDLSFSDDDGIETGKDFKRTRIKSAPIKKKPKTVPSPFKMTLREQEKANDKLLLERVLMRDKDKEAELERLREEETRLFKAKAVPKHVYQPVFQNMVDQYPNRYFIRQSKHLSKAQSTPNLKLEHEFSAKPFPSHIFTGYAYEKMRANLEYREVQKTSRQKALLNKSSLPPRMQTLQQKEGELKQKLKAAKNKENRLKSSPVKATEKIKFHTPVPDFDKLYNNFKATMERKKSSRILTVLQPFSFEPEVQRYIENKSKSKLMLTEKDVIPPKRSQSVPNLILNSPWKIPPGNTTSQLRAQYNRIKLESMGKKDQIEARQKLLLEIRQRELRLSNPAWQDLYREAYFSDDLQAKKTARSIEAKEREREYKMELEKMMTRVQQQPTLFQRQTRLSASQNVEKRYKEVLKKQGLSEAEMEKLIQIKRERRASKTLSEISDNSKIRSPYFKPFAASMSSIYQESEDFTYK